MSRLANKVALITGAARGIGAAISRAFVGNDAFVYVTDINDELGRSTARELGTNATYLHLDVREESDWRLAMSQVLEEKGKIDVVVNNAGITGFESGPVAHDPEHATLQDWHEVHRTNLDGGFSAEECHHCYAANWAGSIINISSRSGLVGIPAAAAYASSKAAVRNHTKTVALYCAQENLNIRCNSIHPAAILTPMWEPMLGDGPQRETRMQAFVRDTPLRRFGLAEEVAAIAVLLASDEARYMTGAELVIDGGILAGSTGTPSVSTSDD